MKVAHVEATARRSSDVGGPQRAHARIAHEAAITVRAGSVVLEGRTKNVSRGGLCADLLAPLPTGADVEIDMKLVFEGESQSEALTLGARIVWCTRVDDRCQIGAVFVPLTAERAKYRVMFLKFLDGGETAKRGPKPDDVDERFK
jgi:hypothetical protein